MDSELFRHEKGNFYGCYLLVSKNPKYKGRTYIGFTVNPNRRIQQHNGGYMKGGAKKTSGKGPWEMVLIVHNFPNMISALRFEWAWQNPEKSLRLKHLVPKKPGYSFQVKFNIVCEMLRTGPWCRLPLVIRWLRQEYKEDFPLSKLPPVHMPTVFGLVEIYTAKSKKKSQLQPTESVLPAKLNCFICSLEICKENILFDKVTSVCKCLNCNVLNHAVCLANFFLKKSSPQLIPVEGNCPKCDSHLMWSDLIKRGVTKSLPNLNNSGSNNEDDDEDEEDEDDEEFEERDDDDDDDEDID